MTTSGSAFERWLPVVSWVRHYRRRDLGGDSAAALTAWAIVVPESVAYAQIAGVPPQNAFYAAPVALIAYAVFGSSRSLVVGATSAAAILSASTVAAVSSDAHERVQLSAALALIAGAILIVAGLARFGFVTNFLAESALQGFLFGMALIIVVRQAGKIVGVSTGDGDFFRRAWTVLRHAGDWSLISIAIGVGAIAALLAIERFIPRLPASLAVLIAGIALSALLHLDEHGVDIVGHIPSAVPSLHVPDVSRHQAVELLGGAFGVALVVFAESYSISSRFAAAHDTEVDGNTEMIAMGASNAVAGAFSGFAVSGSASRTAAAEDAGGKTQMVSLVAAAMVLITAAFLTPLFTDLPEPVLGAIVVVAVRSFLRPAPLIRYWRRDRPSFAIAAVALAGVLVFDLLPGLLIAVALSLILFIARASTPSVVVLGRSPKGYYADLATDPTVVAPPAAIVIRPDGALFFGNVDRVRRTVYDLVTSDPNPPRRACLVLSASFRLSVPVIDALGELEKRLARAGTELWLVALPAAARQELAADETGALIAAGRVVRTIDDAVTAGAVPGG